MLGIYLTLIDDPSDKEKFTLLYQTYNKFMYNLAMSMLHNHALAEETVQDCLLKLANNIQKVPDVHSKKAKAYIVIMVKNRARSNFELEHYKDVEPLEDDDHISDGVIDKIVTDDGYKTLRQAIGELDSTYRDVMVLKFVLESSAEEISKILQLPVRTVETRIYRGRKILKEKLEGTFDEHRN